MDAATGDVQRSRPDRRLEIVDRDGVVEPRDAAYSYVYFWVDAPFTISAAGVVVAHGQADDHGTS